MISTVGNAPNPALAGLAGVDGALDARGWILPDATFAVPGLERVWALGDCASIIDPGTGRPMAGDGPARGPRRSPRGAQRPGGARRTATEPPFDYSQQGMLVSLGRFRGVGEVRGIKVSGFIAWFLWRSYYLLQLPSLERRIRVALDWTLELLPRPRRHRDQHAPHAHASRRVRRRDRGRAGLGGCPAGRLPTRS